VSAADWAGLGALAIALVGLVLRLLAPMRAELEACKKDRRELRLTIQIVVGAIVGLMPEPERLQLLRTIESHLPEEEAA
jgi:hypothetical protein